MKLKKWLPLCCILLLCTGCGKTQREPSTQKALDFRTALMEAGGCTFSAEIAADYGARVYQFSLDCQCSPEGTELTVTAPENIAGIAASVEGADAELSFDGVELEFGRMADGNVTPLSAPWLLHQCWTSEYIASSGHDGSLEVVTYLMGYNDREVTVETWLNAQNLPERCDVSYGGRRFLTIELRNFQFLS